MDKMTTRLVFLALLAICIAAAAYVLVVKTQETQVSSERNPSSAPTTQPERLVPSTAASIPASTVKPAEEQSEPSATKFDRELLISVTVLLALSLAIMCLIVARAAVGWRKAAAGAQISILPSEVLERFDGMHTSMGSCLDATRKNGADVSTRVASINAEIQVLHDRHNEVFKSLQILQAALADRDAEIKRLRKGNDVVVFRKFLGRFLKVLGIIDEEIEAARQAGASTKALDDIRLYVLEALEESGVEKFVPKIGERMQDAFGLGDGAEHEQRPTDRPELHGTIAEVLRCGYAVDSLDGKDCLRGAVVAFYVKKAEENVK